MNKDEQRTLNGLDTDISWIKSTLVRLEKKMDNVEQETQNLTMWKWKVIGVSIGSSTGIALIISVITLILKFTR